MSNFLTDNPALYEQRFPDPDLEHVGLIAEAMDARLGSGARDILDLGSGTGRDAGALAARGHHVVGIDSSPAMVAHAQARHPTATFIEGDLRHSQLGRTFDVVSCMDSALLYCHTHRDLVACGEVLKGHLHRGGIFVAEMRNGAFYLGHRRGLGEPVDDDFVHDGIRYVSRTVLWVDHAAQLLRRRRTWSWVSAEPLVQESAWRLVFPDEIRGWLTGLGFTDITLTDETGESLTGRRLRMVATFTG